MIHVVVLPRGCGSAAADMCRPAGPWKIFAESVPVADAHRQRCLGPWGLMTARLRTNDKSFSFFTFPASAVPVPVDPDIMISRLSLRYQSSEDVDSISSQPPWFDPASLPISFLSEYSSP